MLEVLPKQDSRYFENQADRPRLNVTRSIQKKKNAHLDKSSYKLSIRHRETYTKQDTAEVF